MTLAQRWKMQSNDPCLQAAVYFSFFSSGMVSTLLGAVLPSMKADYGMDYLLCGSVLSAHQAGNFAASCAAGLLPCLIGRKKSTVFLCFWSAAGLAVMTLTGNPVFLLLAFLGTGIGRGTLGNICNVVVSENSADRTASLNLLHAVFAAGALLSPLAAVLAETRLRIGWRPSVWAVACAVAVSLVLLWKSGLSDAGRGRREKADYGFLRSRSFWLNTAILFFYLCSESSIVGWLVTYFQESGVFSAAAAQSTASVLWVMMMAGRTFCAGISGRVGKTRLLVRMAAAQLVLFVLMILLKNPALILLALAGTGLSMSGFYPTVFSTLDRSCTSSTLAVGTCISTATLGAILMPAVVGAVAQRHGIESGFSAIGAALLAMLLLTVIKDAAVRGKRAKTL
ncbi:MFS transporter [Caproiciproducens sp. NJN-50]|uniref:MFS transporter n=1 Tax=Caproiciproducens sp. NJN-50 TaxID=2507162 RepID=UPI000FFE2D6F|nr:MFS transporter [Caproiciproducens sp. NJN-50]QAT48766.1 MFS transporter [Caproiciproducens sp. NJN-50]